jgi:hypothetical protein
MYVNNGLGQRALSQGLLQEVGRASVPDAPYPSLTASFDDRRLRDSVQRASDRSFVVEAATHTTYEVDLVAPSSKSLS